MAVAAACAIALTGADRARSGDPEPAPALIERHACRSCHVIGASGARVGPDLNQVGVRRSGDWLRRWLAEPSAVKADTMMPAFDWRPGELDALVEHLRGLAEPVDGPAIVARTGAGAAAGEALIHAYQCHACHAVAGEQGRALYPPLATVAERRDPDWERRWLADPQAVKPGTFMPTFGLSAAEIEAIVAFLYRR